MANRSLGGLERPLRRGRGTRQAGWRSCRTRSSRRRTQACGDAGAALRGSRPGPLLVGARPARARADEARPPPPSVPRQVHPAACRGAVPPSCAPAWSGARSVRGIRYDARAGARVGARLRGRRYRVFQLPVDRREDAIAQPVRPRARAAEMRSRDSSVGRGRRPPRRRTCARGSRRRRATTCFASARSWPTTSRRKCCA